MHKLMTFGHVLPAALLTTAAMAAEVPVAIDDNPDPDIFETTLVAEVKWLDIDGSGNLIEFWTFGGTVPAPEIRVKEGDQVIVHLENQLTRPTSIHWHGVEVNNPSDGTSVTQAPVMPGQSFTYRFTAPRPGTFYYHPHMKPMNQVFKGMYGSMVVTQDAEATLTKLGVIPQRQMTLVLSDVTVAKPAGENDFETFPSKSNLPWAGGEVFPGNSLSPTPIDLIELTPRTYDGLPGGDPVAANTIPNIAPARDCRDYPEIPCRTNAGQLVLGNGRLPAGRAGSPASPGEVSPSPDSITIPSGRGIRLRLLNAAVERYFRLRATDSQGNLLPLVRIGGEGGLLDEARIEGGIQGSYNTKYDAGEIALGPSQRADVVLIADAPAGDVITIWTRDFERAGVGWTLVPTVPVMHLVVEKPDGGGDVIAAGTPLLTHPAVDEPLESLADLPVTAGFIDPSTLDSPQAGSTDQVIRLTNQMPDGPPYPSIDFVRGAFEGGGPTAPDYISTSRWARVGDLLELVVRNETFAHHPWHHHGFSFQPLRMEDFEGNVVMEYPTEFVDVVDVPGLMQVVYRIRLDDRVQGDGVTTGGAIGRWLFHCHLFHHALIGMITELVVVAPCTGDANADNTVDVQDLLILLESWGGRSAAADANLDGTVDTLDLLQMLNHWGACE